MTNEQLITRFRIENCQTIRDRIVSKNLGLCYKTAARYGWSPLPREDRNAIAVEALLRAVDTYDTEGEVPFYPYALRFISSELRAEAMAASQAVSIKRSGQAQKVLYDIPKRAAEFVSKGLNEDTALERAAKQYGVTVKSAREGMMLRAAGPALAVEDAYGLSGDDGSHGDPKRTRELLRSCLDELDDKSREVVERTVFAEEPETVAAVAASMGVSGPAVSQRVGRAMQKLRKDMKRRGLRFEHFSL